VLVKSLKTGDTLYAFNPQKLLLPASNMKIVTLAAAAERLGWDYTYETRLVTGGRIDGGTLAGDLIVVGSGDPSVMVADGSAAQLFDEWANALKQRGIRTIAGRVVGNDDAFDDLELGFGWSWDDLPDDYAAGVGALQFNESAVRVTVTPGPTPGDSAAIAIEPPGSGITVVSRVTTGAAEATTAITTARLPGRQRLQLGGTIAHGSAPSTLTVSVDNPTLFFVEALRQALIARGIDVRGAAVDADDLAEPPPLANATLLASHRSPPLSTLAVRLMKVSQNQYAETLLKSLTPSGSPATAEGGRAAARAIFDAWGIAAGGLIQRDGSGLSRYDFVTAETLVAILSHVWADDRLRAPFEASLPVLGRDGTLSNRLKGTSAEGMVRAKTGSMSQVRALSGYVTSADGEPLVFAILANNFDTPAAVVNGATDRIVIRLAQFRR
jgi:D-alanyl-D-alanine carboxypeptidase/D-alanyl-D-alanine-endopeptidase (penicillin-binding protein 4)